tara:strand:+ start:127 stop:522 length:396 start_codon:yes stop_codon:yes gene_type:complete
MKDFKIIIIAYGYRTSFIIKAEDSSESIENAIVDKLGENSVKWDTTGFYDTSRKWITYEEVINDRGPNKQKKSLELSWEQEHLNEGRYNLNMVAIDAKIREIITAIKLEEAKIADRENAILNSAPEVSVAT